MSSMTHVSPEKSPGPSSASPRPAPRAPFSRWALAAAAAAVLSPAGLRLFYLPIPLWLSFLIAFTVPACAIAFGAISLWRIRVCRIQLSGEFQAMGAVMVGIALLIIVGKLRLNLVSPREEKPVHYLAPKPVH